MSEICLRCGLDDRHIPVIEVKHRHWISGSGVFKTHYIARPEPGTRDQPGAEGFKQMSEFDPCLLAMGRAIKDLQGLNIPIDDSISRKVDLS